MPSRKAADALVIFGITGDLAHKQTIKALYRLEAAKKLDVPVIGVARNDWDKQSIVKHFRAALRENKIKVEKAVFDRLAKRLDYIKAVYDEDECYANVLAKLTELKVKRPAFYLEIPPSLFGMVVKGLYDVGVTKNARFVIEKPFGHDLASAKELNAELSSMLEEDQIYRIDHYLGKETVQNLLVLRFANGIFEPIWNNRYVDHVQVTGAETVGVERRGGYFEQAGILRDMVQNHLMQVVSLAAMEPPVALDADGVRDEKLKVLKALRPINTADLGADVVRGQYTAGSVLGQTVPAYRDEPGVSPTSDTETFVALKLYIDSWRWAGVPFYLRSAKRMPKRATEIAIHFKKAPHLLFGRRGEHAVRPNVLAIRIQPDEGITLNFGSKLPGPAMEVAPVSMEFRYGTSFGAEPPEAYERLLLDCLLGDGTLFTRGDEAEASWSWISRIHEAWRAANDEGAKDLEPYPAGSWGPPGADALLARGGHVWRRP